MTFSREITAATAFYMQLSIIMLITVIPHSKARELRPSDHGLEYQRLPPTGAKLPPDMKHFFGASDSATRNTMSPSTGAALPKANNRSNDTSWWRAADGGGKGRGGDHVKHLLLVACLVCGVTGLGLLVSSAFICYHFIRHKSRPSSSSSSAAAAAPAPDNNHRSMTVHDGKK